MMTPIKFDKRLYDKHMKSGELSRDEIAAHEGTLPDLSEEFRYRAVEGAESSEESSAEGEAENTGGSDEQG
jgi:hypothetical protein